MWIYGELQKWLCLWSKSYKIQLPFYQYIFPLIEMELNGILFM